MQHEFTALSERSLLWIRGDGAEAFLEGLVTADVAALKTTKATYAGLLTPQGKILFDFFLTAKGDGYLVDADGPAQAAKFLQAQGESRSGTGGHSQGARNRKRGEPRGYR
jgi:folate-binding Fe-S cluster repair protein YgfZ